ncbi:MAG: flavodoxin family protein [Euryarchaeota archaeon]|nr:flavodoxin family protein [Euryarchaeota archaeon]
MSSVISTKAARTDEMTKAIVFYDSRYGNTETVARAIMEGMKKGGIEDVLLASMKTADEEDFRGRDLWVIGSPTHWGSATFRLKTLLVNAMKDEGKDKRAAVFDTRYKGMSRGASGKISSLLETYGIPLVTEPMAFYVESGGSSLASGEAEKAQAYGAEIAGRSR